MNDEKRALLEAIETEVNQLPEDWSVEVSYDIHMLMAVIAALQLAMRHPGFRGSAFHAVRHAVTELMAGIPETMPAMRELARLGDNRKYDEPFTPPSPPPTNQGTE